MLLIGIRKDVAAITRIKFAILLPITAPTARSEWFVITALILLASSGKEVPPATITTPIANKEVIMFKNDWPVDKRINNMNYLQIKSRILARKINHKTDWRLDTHKSIEGGIIYLKELKKYWTKKSSVKLLNQTFKRDIPWTDILLASYNSGAYRVKKSIKRNKRSWLQDQELQEAKKYVKNIKSYCHAFSDLNTNLQDINNKKFKNSIVKN